MQKRSLNLKFSRATQFCDAAFFSEGSSEVSTLEEIVAICVVELLK